MDIQEAVKRSKKHTLKRGEVISWVKVKELLGGSESPEHYRAIWRNQFGNRPSDNDSNVKVRLSTSRDFKKGIQDSKAILVSELKRERTINELCYATGYTELELLGSIEKLRIEGYSVVQFRLGEQIGYTINTNVQPSYYEYKHYHDVSSTFKIGIVSDTHIGSLYWQRTFLKMAYDDFKANKITEVYHAGDISDGVYPQRAGNMFELYARGFDEQVDAIIQDFPRVEGITTFFITGNHDLTHQYNGGANIGIAVERARPDLKYLGQEFAKIWLTPKVDLDLEHPGGGSAYALSYRTQKRIDAMSGGLKPKILAVGHFHKNMYYFYRNIHVLPLASFQAQTPFLRRGGIISDVGYVIVEISVNENGDIIRFTPTYCPMYVPIKEKF